MTPNPDDRSSGHEIRATFDVDKDITQNPNSDNCHEPRLSLRQMPVNKDNDPVKKGATSSGKVKEAHLRVMAKDCLDFMILLTEQIQNELEDAMQKQNIDADFKGFEDCMQSLSVQKASADSTISQKLNVTKY